MLMDAIPARSAVAAVIVLFAWGFGSAVRSACADRPEPPAWPAFLGPSSAPLDAGELPLHWSAERGVAWKADLAGYGQSSPVVWGGQVFVTSISGSMKETCHVAAYDLATGKQQWRKNIPAAMRVQNTNYTSKAAPTPVADERGVIAWFESGNLVAIAHDGTIRWKRDLVEAYGAIDTRHGLGSSPVQTEQLVIVWVERETDPYLVAIDKASGKTVWKVDGLGAASWSTPCLLEVGGRQHLVLSASGILAGLDPVTGKRLWRLEGLTGNTIPSPRPIGDGTLIVGAAPSEDGAGSGNTARSNGIIRVTPRKEEKGFDVVFRWNCRRATCSFGSPVIHRGRAYFVNRAGVLFCVDADSGRELFAQRIGGTIWATPLPVGDRIYLVGKSGTTIVIEAADKYRKLAENRLSGARKVGANEPLVQYAVVAVGDALLIRTGRRLFCIRKDREPAAPLE